MCWLTEASTLARQTLAVDDVRASAVWLPLGRLYTARHRREAQPVLRDALALRAREFAPDDPRIAEVQVALAEALSDAGRSAEATRLARATDAALAVLPDHQPLVTQLRRRLAALMAPMPVRSA